MDDNQLISLVRRMAREAMAYRDTLAEDRSDAVDYYNGDMEKALPVKAGHSSIVSKDVRAAISRILPSITRTLLSTEAIFEFEPVGQEDEEQAEQASDYINLVVFPKSKGVRACKAVLHDACLLRNGILRVDWQKRKKVEISEHTGLDEAGLAELVAGDDVEVLEQSASQELVELDDGTVVPTDIYAVKIRRTVEKGELKIDPVPLERFLIDPTAQELDEATLVGTVERVKLSDLVSMGYDKDKVLALPIDKEGDDATEQARDDRVDAEESEEYSNPALREVDYYELYVRVDRDGDGLGELLRICMAGGLQQTNLLSIDDWDEHPFVDFVIEDVPHQWQGVSIHDDVGDLQKLKTALWREVLDNIYWQNKPQPIVNEGGIANMDAVMNPVFGKPILIEGGRKAEDVISFTKVPFVAKNAFDMLGFVDEVIQDRTGITEASAGMAPDALQNMTAKASAMIEAAGIGRTEMIVRSFAQGMQRLGKRILRLIVQHQDRETMVRLRKQWVAYDPRHWNAEMDVQVNTGLGAGSRERDLQMLQLISLQQEKLLAAYGPDNPFVSPDNLYTTLEKMTESAGFPSAEPFFTQPDPEQVRQKIAEQAQQPSEAEMKVKAQIELEQAKLEAAKAKEKAQMDADLMVKRAEIAANAKSQAEKLRSDVLINDQKMAFEREKMQLERELAMLEMNKDIRIAKMRQESDIQRAQAAEIGKALNGQDNAAQQ